MTKKYPQPPAMSVDPSKKYTATVKTVRGDFSIDLRPDLAPQNVNSFVFLARDHFYDGVTFHRVVAGFVAQAGDPTGTGSGGPGYTLPLEPSDVPFERGVVGVARANDPNSAGSQWFVTFGNAGHLTNQYTVLGTVSQGMDVADCIQKGDAITTIEVQEQ
jgi:peptidylprolyl isomerase